MLHEVQGERAIPRCFEDDAMIALKWLATLRYLMGDEHVLHECGINNIVS